MGKAQRKDAIAAVEAFAPPEPDPQPTPEPKPRRQAKAQNRAQNRAQRQAERQRKKQAAATPTLLRPNAPKTRGKADLKPLPTPLPLQPQAPRPKPRRRRLRLRHLAVLVSFLLAVVAPTYGVFWYFENRAAPQYASTLGFTVRQEEARTPLDIVGGALGTGASTADSDILFEYIQSQRLVREVDSLLDLTRLYTKPADDPWFALAPGGAIEDLRSYWQRMVRVQYDSTTGLTEVEVRAFDPQDARNIAQAILTSSTRLVNELSTIAQADLTRAAREERDMALDRLKQARAAVTDFRNTNQMVNPGSDLQSQMGLLGSLQQQLADALIELDLLGEVTRKGDPRIAQAERKIKVIRARIADERSTLGAAQENSTGFSALVGQFEELQVDLEFAETAYVNALSAYNAALADARRQTRYLAAYIPPTLAETPEYPRAEMTIGLFALFAGLIWATGTLLFYSLRDRRSGVRG